MAHGDGNFFADDATLDRLEGEGRVAFRYADAKGAIEAIDKLQGAVVVAMRTPLIIERLNAEGAAPEPTTPEALRKLIEVDSQRWAKAVKISGAKLD